MHTFKLQLVNDLILMVRDHKVSNHIHNCKIQIPVD